MGTRGFIGFVIDGQEKITYNHWDSYPDGLGLTMLEWTREVAFPQLEGIKMLARDLKVVDGKVPPTDIEISKLSKWADTGVSNRTLDDWYCLLRKTQGQPMFTLAAGYALDSSEFPLDSLMCEWGYIVDLDNVTFETYKGFQEAPHNRGRFAHRAAPKDAERRLENGIGVYYPVALCGAWSFNALPSNDDFLAVVCDPETEEE